jgi:transcriptional regulator with XRE-family HTH domain
VSVRLNTALIRARRLELGLSERKFASLTGLGQAVVRGIESGSTHKDLTLGDLDRVAATLSVSLTTLLEEEVPQLTPEQVAGPLTEQEFRSHCMAMVGALLFDVGRLVPVESLARTVDLSLGETHRVLTELDALLRPAGLLVHRLGNSVKLWRTSDAVPHEMLQRTWRSQLARRGLDAGQARLLHQTLSGRRDKTLTNDQQVTAAELVNAGLLERTRSGGVELSDDVRYSLLLDEVDTHSSR